jgi:hypothetical protein
MAPVVVRELNFRVARDPGVVERLAFLTKLIHMLTHHY